MLKIMHEICLLCICIHSAGTSQVCIVPIHKSDRAFFRADNIDVSGRKLKYCLALNSSDSLH